MSVPFRIRRAEWVAGAMVIFVVTASIVSLLFVSGGKGTFDTPAAYKLMLANGHGVTEGSRVQMLGIDVGRVAGVKITGDNRVEIDLEIRARFADKVRADTTASLQASFGLQGVLSGIGVALTPGSADAAALAFGDTIFAVEPEHIADMLPGFSSDPLVQDLEVLIRNLRVLTDEATDPQGSLRQALLSLAAVSKRIEAGEGTAGKMLSDDAALYGDITDALGEVSATLSKIDGLVRKSSGVVDKSSRAMDGADDLVQDAGALVASADSMVQTADDVLEKTGPVLVHTDDAVGELSAVLSTFGDATGDLQAVTKKLDTLIEEMLVVTEAAGRVYPIRRQIRKARRQGK
ncbi:MAG: MCE family protein [Nannocystaceae bacterium]|nr:MCE family protein [Nannocystaceae bacterium]